MIPPLSQVMSVHGRLRSLADSDGFEFVTILLILLNAAILGLDTYPDFHNAYDLGFGLILWSSQLLFAIEIAIRVGGFGPRYRDFFRNPWNSFDFAVVAVSFIPAVGGFAVVGRVARVLRVARILSVSDETRVRFGSGGGIARFLLQIAVFAIVIVYVFAVSGATLFGDSDPDRWAELDNAVLTLVVQPQALLTSPSLTFDRGLAAVFFASYVAVWLGLLLRIARAAALRRSAQA